MKYHLIPLGCQMNKSDAERIARVLEDLGYEKTDEEKSADLIVVVSCSVRQNAIHKIYSWASIWNVEKAKRIKNGHEPLMTILTGCVLPKDKKNLGKMFDILLNIKELSELKNRLESIVFECGDINTTNPPSSPCQGRSNTPLIRGARGVKDVSAKEEEKKQKSNQNQNVKKENDYLNIKPIYQNPWSAFVPIMTGCNNFCTYCAVPYTRGREVSRSIKDILQEVQNLIDSDCLEVTLLGQNVNTFNPEDIENFSKNNPYKDNFAGLLWEIDNLKSQKTSKHINRIHFTAPHPKDMSDEVIDALTLPRMVNYLHIPAQSGDDEILHRMNRNYTADDFIKLLDKIKNKKPKIALGTDLIVGFPGESEEQFNNTVELYKKVGFDISYTAKYSTRPGTVAEKFDDDVSDEEKKRRWRVMQKLMEDITLEKNQKHKGKEVEVLVDKVVSATNPHPSPLPRGGIQYTSFLYEGNSREYKRVRFYSNKDLLGKIINIKINKALTWILEGEVV